MTRYSRSRNARAHTRQRLLDLLKVEGPCDVRTLASRLKVSTMAVRQHLYALRIQKAVDSRDEMRPMGRPARIWSLKRAADRYFPDSHAALSLDLLRVARSALGDDLLRDKLLAWARERARLLVRRLRSKASLRARLHALWAVHARHGYMPGIEAEKDGAVHLVQNHCPIRVAAADCESLCEAELELIRAALGPRCTVLRTAHLLAGQSRCVYRIEERRGRVSRNGTR
jgi:predicted ArsR family transcriptional regulator